MRTGVIQFFFSSFFLKCTVAVKRFFLQQQCNGQLLLFQFFPYLELCCQLCHKKNPNKTKQKKHCHEKKKKKFEACFETLNTLHRSVVYPFSISQNRSTFHHPLIHRASERKGNEKATVLEMLRHVACHSTTDRGQLLLKLLVCQAIVEDFAVSSTHVSTAERKKEADCVV